MLEESASAIQSSIWASMNNWFTPTVLFLLLNLMIGTIAFTSTLSNQQSHQPKPSQSNDPNPIARSPSVLQRLKSINFNAFQPHPEPQDPSSPHHKPNPDSDAAQHLDAQAVHYFFNHTPQETVEAAHQENQTQTHYVYEQIPQETQTHFDLDDKDSSFDIIDEAHQDKIEENEEKSMDEVYSLLTGGHFSRTQSDTKPSSGEIPEKLSAKMKKSASMKSPFGHFEEEDIVEARRPATVRERGTDAADDGVDAKADDFINRFKQQLKLQRLDSIIRYKDIIGRGR